MAYNHIEARIVGGAVRDALLNKPIYDIDIAAAADPKCVSAALNSLCKVVPTGLEHGTITAVFSHNTFQITSLRRDIKTDGRHAVVSFGTSFEEDAKRRDFTINALYLDKNGQLYDYFNGEEDLKKGIVRFIGDPKSRITEDYLRILRFFRMNAFYGNEPFHNESLVACRDLSAGIQTLSRERIRHEFFQILVGPKMHNVINAMAKMNVLDAVDHFYDLRALKLYTECEERENLSIDPFFRLFGLFWAEPVENIATGFVFTKKERMLWSRLYHWQQQQDISVSALLYHEGMDTACHILCLSESISGNSFEVYFKKLKMLESQEFPLKAQDLSFLNLKGKQLGEALEAAKKYWLENDFHPKKEDLLEFLQHSLF